MKKNILILITILILGVILGRWTLPQKIKIEYLPGIKVHDSIPYSVPYKVEIPANPVLPLKPDTIKLSGDTTYIAQVVDTAQIIADYIKKNYYQEILFDNDTLGSFSFEAQVQYNKLQYFGYSFTPIHKQTTITQKRVFEPFILSSVNTLGYFGLGAGAYYNNTGFGLKYLTDFKQKGVELQVSVKF